MNPRRRALVTAVAALFAGCSPLKLINDLAPSDTYSRTANLPYGEHPRQRLDVYTPVRPRVSTPVVVFFYGGSWNSGSRADYLFVGEALASRGFVVVVADYRLYPEVKFPEFLHDSARAVAWTRANAVRYGGDPAQLFVMGHSAGAYNAAMITLDERYLEFAGVDPRGLQGFIGLAGPYDFLPLTSRITRGVFGWPDTPPATQPINFVNGTTPRTLLITGKGDTVVDPGNSVRLAARMRAHGGTVRELVYERLDHRTVIGALAVPLRELAPVLDEVAQFVNTPG